MSNSENADTIHISRYSSRRLYNTNTSEYVTVEDVADLIRNGHDIVVTDKKSGDDITRQILLQIITEHENRGDHLLPVNVLTDIVRSYRSGIKSVIPEFLSGSFSALKAHQEELLGSLQEQMVNPFDARVVMKNLETWKRVREEMLDSMVSPWLPRKGESETGSSGSAGVQREPTNNRDGRKDDRTSIESELAEMKRQIEKLEEKLNEN